jgi:hypothetical protein
MPAFMDKCHSAIPPGMYEIFRIIPDKSFFVQNELMDKGHSTRHLWSFPNNSRYGIFGICDFQDKMNLYKFKFEFV